MSAAGNDLPTLRREVTQQVIDAYAEVSGDHNPLHLDPAFAAQTPFGGTIAHGMLMFGYLSDLMGATYGAAWAINGRLRVRFRAPARPGDVLLIGGEVRSRDAGPDGQTMIRCALECKRSDGQVLATGDASVTISQTV